MGWSLGGRRGPRKLTVIFKDHLLQDRELCIPTNREAGKTTRRPAWVSKELLDKSSTRRKPTEGVSKGE